MPDPKTQQEAAKVQDQLVINSKAEFDELLTTYQETTKWGQRVANFQARTYWTWAIGQALNKYQQDHKPKIDNSRSVTSDYLKERERRRALNKALDQVDEERSKQLEKLTQDQSKFAKRLTDIDPINSTITAAAVEHIAQETGYSTDSIRQYSDQIYLKTWDVLKTNPSASFEEIADHILSDPQIYRIGSTGTTPTPANKARTDSLASQIKTAVDSNSRLERRLRMLQNDSSFIDRSAPNPDKFIPNPTDASSNLQNVINHNNKPGNKQELIDPFYHLKNLALSLPPTKESRLLILDIHKQIYSPAPNSDKVLTQLLKITSETPHPSQPSTTTNHVLTHNVGLDQKTSSQIATKTQYYMNLTSFSHGVIKNRTQAKGALEQISKHLNLTPEQAKAFTSSLQLTDYLLANNHLIIQNPSLLLDHSFIGHLTQYDLLALQQSLGIDGQGLSSSEVINLAHKQAWRLSPEDSDQALSKMIQLVESGQITYEQMIHGSFDLALLENQIDIQNTNPDSLPPTYTSTLTPPAHPADADSRRKIKLPSFRQLRSLLKSENLGQVFNARSLGSIGNSFKSAFSNISSRAGIAARGALRSLGGLARTAGGKAATFAATKVGAFLAGLGTATAPAWVLGVIVGALIIVLLIALFNSNLFTSSFTDSIGGGPNAGLGPGGRFITMEPLCWPSLGKITRKNVVGHDSYNEEHNSIDIANDLGEGVYSPLEGTVVHAGCYLENCDELYGLLVSIEGRLPPPSNKLVRLHFAHLEDLGPAPSRYQVPTIAVGQKVRVGQLLGTMGNSGNSTGPHLHYELTSSTNEASGIDITSITPDPNLPAGEWINERCSEDLTELEGNIWIARSTLAKSNIVVTSPGDSSPAQFACSWASNQGLEAAVNANVWQKGQLPIGLAGSGGNVVDYLNADSDYAYDSFVWTKTSSSPSIPLYSEYAGSGKESDLYTAVTGFPILIDNGDVQEHKMYLSLARTMLGFNQDEFFLVVAEKANGYDLVEIAQDLDMTHAVNLDGGGKSSFCEGGNTLFGGNITTPINIGLKEATIETLTVEADE